MIMPNRQPSMFDGIPTADLRLALRRESPYSREIQVELDRRAQVEAVA